MKPVRSKVEGLILHINHNKYKILLTLFFSLLFAFPVFPQGLEFYREDITFEIKDGYFYVNGVYHLCNVGEKEIKKYISGTGKILCPIEI